MGPTRSEACCECGFSSVGSGGTAGFPHLDSNWLVALRLGDRLLRGAVFSVPFIVFGLLLLGAMGNLARSSSSFAWILSAIEPLRWGVVGGAVCVGGAAWLGLVLLFAEDPFEDWMPMHTAMRGLNAVASPLLGFWVGFTEFGNGRLPMWLLISMTILLATHAVVLLAWCAKLEARFKGQVYRSGTHVPIRPDTAIWTTLIVSGVLLAVSVARSEDHWFRAIWITWFLAIAFASTQVHRALSAEGGCGKRDPSEV